MRLNLTHLRPPKTQPRPGGEECDQPDPDATTEGDAPGDSGPQLESQPDAPRTQPDAPATQAESPATAHGRKETRRGDAPRTHRDKRDARRDKRDATRAALRRRASSLVSHATGRHYERVGFTTKGRRTLAYILLAGVLSCVAWMSWDGEHGWARQRLHWRDPQALLVPGSLDIAGMYCALRGLDLIDKGESAIGHRIMAAVFVGMGAWINWRNELPTGDITREVFFPVMTLLAYGLIHFEMAAARREARRRQHGETSKERPKPLPRFGALAWVPGLGDPSLAFDALREAVRRRLMVALAGATSASETHPLDDRDDEETHDDQDATGSDQDSDEETHDEDRDDAPPLPDLTQMRQADAIRWVLATVPGAAESTMVAVTYLRSHGYPNIKSQRVSDQRRRDTPATMADAPATIPDAPATEPETEGVAQ